MMLGGKIGYQTACGHARHDAKDGSQGIVGNVVGARHESEAKLHPHHNQAHGSKAEPDPAPGLAMTIQLTENVGSKERAAVEYIAQSGCEAEQQYRLRHLYVRNDDGCDDEDVETLLAEKAKYDDSKDEVRQHKAKPEEVVQCKDAVH